jgi:hypothetical protein
VTAFRFSFSSSFSSVSIAPILFFSMSLYSRLWLLQFTRLVQVVLGSDKFFWMSFFSSQLPLSCSADVQAAHLFYSTVPTQNHWLCGRCPYSGSINICFGNSICFHLQVKGRRHTLLGRLERDDLSSRNVVFSSYSELGTMNTVHNTSGSVIHHRQNPLNSTFTHSSPLNPTDVDLVTDFRLQTSIVPPNKRLLR